MRRRFQFSLKMLLAVLVCAAFFFGGMSVQRAIDLREKRLNQAEQDEWLVHERILDLRLENAAKKLGPLPEGD